ncbi:MAG: carbohydrate ABC transporter substrate-binding protein [Clostridia bacterium]|nr:carbohydrate ABC transporter substrate-binding protein [Clostridia bacterium]
MKKITALILCLVLCAGAFVSCTDKNNMDNNAGEDTATLQVAVLESAYGSEMWQRVAEAYEKVSGKKVELTAEKNLEDVIGSQMKGGDYPDVVHLATGREAGLTETMIKDGSLTSLEKVLEMKIPGEEKTVEDKLIDGFTDTLATNPYSDRKTYLAPMFYSPCGLFYNADLLSDMGWDVPETWDEMWELGDKAKAEGIYLFTYPTAGYFDAFMYSLLASAGGVDFYNQCMNYGEGVWDTAEAREVLDTVGRLAEYTEPTTVANSTGDNYLKNQQLILDGKALFMPNGTWVVEEMKDAPRREGFQWGFTALPAIDEDSYAYTFFEQCWIPKEAKNKDGAMEFIAFLYSDTAADIFAEYGAIQPIEGIADKLSGDNKLFYSVYEDGAKAVMGGFAATEAVAGVSIYDTLFESINSVVSGDKTVEEWKADIKKVSDKLRENLK